MAGPIAIPIITAVSSFGVNASSTIAASSQSAANMTGGHRRILVVEDDPETAGQLVEELTTSGYEVDLAATGREALSHGAARDYAVITIDRMSSGVAGS